MSERCQVDFYLLAAPGQDPDRLTCKLAMMAWERGHRVTVVAADETAADTLDELMWRCPEGRFLPHEKARIGAATAAPVNIVVQPPQRADVVINRTARALPDTSGFARLLEIVPHDVSERTASREKFRAYRGQGLNPGTHEIR